MTFFSGPGIILFALETCNTWYKISRRFSNLARRKEENPDRGRRKIERSSRFEPKYTKMSYGPELLTLFILSYLIIYFIINLFYFFNIYLMENHTYKYMASL